MHQLVIKNNFDHSRMHGTNVKIIAIRCYISHGRKRHFVLPSLFDLPTGCNSVYKLSTEVYRLIVSIVKIGAPKTIFFFHLET